MMLKKFALLFSFTNTEIREKERERENTIQGENLCVTLKIVASVARKLSSENVEEKEKTNEISQIAPVLNQV